ncbi:hypothetical protein HYR99_12550 [Candidatus Poribacteria bacterium]|nr:hypothetical protein [Candidatus Poribacteria bacterium]
MFTWREMLLKRDDQGFTDGLNDARRHTVDPIAYQINREYRNGVDIAQQLMATFDAAWNEKLNIPIAGGTVPFSNTVDILTQLKI